MIKKKLGNGYIQRQTHQNTDKEQISLAPGSAEYDAYLEDLAEVDPYNDKDEWHNEMHERNEEHDDLLADKAEAAQNYETQAAKKTYRNKMAKEARSRQVRREAMEIARSTPSREDDKIAAGIGREDEILNQLEINDAVTADEYVPKALSKYLD